MSCFRPLQAYQCSDGSVVFDEVRGPDIVRPLLLACGRCVGCCLESSRQWAVRCMHEAQMHREPSSFVTFTYKPERCPPTLQYRDFQLFMKRLRKERNAPVRYFVAGEYGESHGRPHFHALLFGCHFGDRVHRGRSPGGGQLYSSGVLERLWPDGFTSIGDVTFQSAAYVARYVMKKRMTSQPGEKEVEIFNVETGEIVRRVAEFCHMSLKPGIGAAWFERFKSDVYPEGKVVVNGHEALAPRYYDRLFERGDEEGFEALAYAREVAGRARYLDNTPERLAVKERVTVARIRSLKRSI